MHCSFYRNRFVIAVSLKVLFCETQNTGKSAVFSEEGAGSVQHCLSSVNWKDSQLWRTGLCIQSFPSCLANLNCRNIAITIVLMLILFWLFYCKELYVKLWNILQRKVLFWIYDDLCTCSWFPAMLYCEVFPHVVVWRRLICRNGVWPPYCSSACLFLCL